MTVESYTATQYTVTCDRCGRTEVCPDGNAERVHSKQQAIKWAKVEDRRPWRVLPSAVLARFKV